MKMKKLSEDHYIVVDDSDIKIGDIVAEKLLTGKYELFTIQTLNDIDEQTQIKITHSTQPESFGTGWMKSIQPLFLSEVKELLGVVDVDNIVDELSEKPHYTHSSQQEWFKIGAYSGYNQALEDNKNKVSLKDLKRFLAEGRYTISKDLGGNITADFTELISLLTSPKTEWEVEIVDGKLKLIQ